MALNSHGGGGVLQLQGQPEHGLSQAGQGETLRGMEVWRMSQARISRGNSSFSDLALEHSLPRIKRRGPDPILS